MSHYKSVVFGSGPLGVWVAVILAKQGWEVSLVNRSGKLDQTLPSNIKVLAADATDEDSVYQICKDAGSVFHCAMPKYTQWATQFIPLTQGILKGVMRTNAKLIYADNLYMYGDTQGLPITELSPCNAIGHKGKVRMAMADILLVAHAKGDVGVTIGRASDFYGPQVINSGLGKDVFKNALLQKPLNVLGNIELAHSYTYIKDFARALVILSDQDQALGEIWHIPNAPTISTKALLDCVQTELGQNIKVRATGKKMLSVLGLFNPMLKELKEMMYAWDQPYIVEHNKFQNAFSMPVTSTEIAIQETLAWYREHYNL
ncbi:NAD-dependent epimerase/dehydratase [Psychromonas sp. CNPT3]|uniref:SDR family oxidoreductase n=1 Tax=Psychromonas sp. CNPT3 TaxID=314282 RepID=UPI00006E70C8|nr:SDR family oxidoreductase [Psychromonas sp. CNPT3]AGH81486.1 NAD-dependent epimerase/dehydratase [Psychromonas sp. CNPT3]